MANDIKPTIILVSLDGFHPSYLQRLKDGNINMIAAEGVQAQWMTPVFPSKTFPCHYTLVTGLYSEHHGIIHNSMYDTLYKSTFSLGKRTEVQSSHWWQGEPIWITAEKAGIKTAPLFFPGSEAEISGTRPAFWKAYDGNMTNSAEVDTILAWLDLPPQQRPQFCTLYFSDLDDAGHNGSPHSAAVDSAIKKVDRDIGRLVSGLTKRQLYNSINLIIVSDHGMACVDPGHIIILDDYFDEQNAEVIIWDQQLTGIFPIAGKEDELYLQLKNSNPARISIWQKKDIPERFHYRENRRIPPIVCLADEGWIIMKRSAYEKKQREGSLSLHATGAHGYDNQLESMQAIFLARGPAFKQGLSVGPFQSIQLYNLMARILDITPAANDGNMDFANQILR